MRRRSRTIRVLKWSGTATCALIAAVLIISTRWSIGYVQFPYLGIIGSWVSIGVASGSFYFELAEEPSIASSLPLFRRGHGWFIDKCPVASIATFTSLKAGYDGWNAWRLVLPLWLLLLIALLPTTLLWYSSRRPPPGHCLHCGYNLIGNTTGRCPECGTIAQA